MLPDARRTDDVSGVERAGFAVALAFVFLRFSFLHEILAQFAGVDLYLVLVFGATATLAAIFSGGLQRTFRWRAAQFWGLFALWMLLDVPSSQWRSDSLNTWFQYIRISFPMLFIIAGFTLTVRDCYRMLSALALAGIVNIGSAFLFNEGKTRLNLEGGSIANSNDYAAHLLLILPILLWVGLAARHKVMRIGAVVLVIIGIFTGAETGSRGAMIAVAAVSIFLIVRLRGAARVVSVVVLPVFTIAVILFLPQSLRDRYMTTFQEDQTNVRSNEAVAAFAARKHLLTSSLELTLQNPMFGVGPNEFTIAEADVAKSEGKRGAWQPPHNSYTQVASEEGIPALIFFVAAVITTFRMFNRCYSRCAGRPDLRRFRLGAFCLMLSMVGFGVAIFFLNMPYAMYLPALTGLAIAFSQATDRELQSAPAAS